MRRKIIRFRGAPTTTHSFSLNVYQNVILLFLRIFQFKCSTGICRNVCIFQLLTFKELIGTLQTHKICNSPSLFMMESIKMFSTTSLRQTHEQSDISKNHTVRFFLFSSTKYTHPSQRQFSPNVKFHFR